MLVQPALVLAVTMLPMILWVDASRSLTAFFAVNLLLGFFNNVNAPALYAAIAELLPPENRSRGFALIYSMPVAALGGTTQMFITWLLHVTGSSLALGWYLTFIGVVGLVVALLLPESAPVRRGWRPALA